MKTNKLVIAFRAVTAFELRCKSTASRGCRRVAGWQTDEAGMETEQAVPEVMESCWQARWPVDQESRLERGAPPNKVETQILAERPL